MITRIDRFVASGAIAALGLYRRFISPALPQACRFVPTCSEYAIEALRKHGILKGSALAFRRLLKCHPLGGSGLDQVR